MQILKNLNFIFYNAKYDVFYKFWKTENAYFFYCRK